MGEPEVQMTEFEALVAEFRKTAGPLEHLASFISNGIEMEHFATTAVGKIFIGRAIAAARAALELVLDPNTADDRVLLAVQELRVQHRLLDTISTTIAAGRQAEAQVRAEDNFRNDDEEDTDQ